MKAEVLLSLAFPLLTKGFTLVPKTSLIRKTCINYVPPETDINDIFAKDIDERLLNIAHKLKLEIFDLDEGIYGFDCKDQRYGLEVIQTTVDISNGEGIGLVLTEVARSDERGDGRGLVLVSEVTGNAAKASSPIHVGDVITGVHNSDYSVRERTTAVNYDLTVESIGNVKEACQDGKLSLQLNRLVKRARIQVEVDDGSGEIKTIEALAGENLRRLLMRKGVKLYDTHTKRFDMPFATGDCAGEGLCGTCLVAVKEGIESLNEADSEERLVCKGRPLNWRASCRSVVGVDNKPAVLKISTHPQSRYADELDPGVRSLSKN